MKNTLKIDSYMSKKKQMVSFLANDGKPFIAQKTGRNYLCRCGSGKKAKKCCGTETKYFLPKVKPDINPKEDNSFELIDSGKTVNDSCLLYTSDAADE